MSNDPEIYVYDIDSGALTGKVRAPFGSSAITWSPGRSTPRDFRFRNDHLDFGIRA